MVSEKDEAFIKKTIFDIVSFEYSGEIKIHKGTHLRVYGDKNEAEITYSEKAELARGFFLLAKELSAGKEQIAIEQSRHFKTLGIMPGLHTNTLTVSGLKKYLAYAAAVGMNNMLFYVEDHYELDGYPYFGYMSGRYSHEDMKELDTYAEQLGIEIVPCIQTLAHLQTYMRWGESAPVKETSASLMVGAEETYVFIEKMLKTMKECFHTNKIHLGMDEARQLGLGKYLNEHEYKPKSELFAEHLNRVKDLCKKYHYEPEIWSDMIFKSCGGYDEEYSKKAVITDEVRRAVQGVGLVYWDYYQDDKDIYKDTIERHRQIYDDVRFAGGIWNWDEYLPNFAYTMKTMKPAMESCLDMNIETVYATVWDDPKDTFLQHSIYDFAIFSEYCYLGYDCTEDDIHSVGEFLTGNNRDMLSDISEFFLGYDGATRMGPRLINTDAFYEFVRYPVDYKEASSRFFKAAEKLKKYSGNELSDYAIQALIAAAEKSDLLSLLRPMYQKRDIEGLKNICEKNFPACIEAISLLGDWMEKLWQKNQKIFGIENVQIRFAGMVKRLKYQREQVLAFANGRITKIPELEEKVLNDECATWLTWEQHTYVRLG